MLLKLSVFAAISLGLTSCGAGVYSKTGTGLLFSQVKEGEMVTSNKLGAKVGTGSAQSILGWVLLGDASVESAAKSAGITRISHVDSEKYGILGIFSTYKVYVYGE